MTKFSRTSCVALTWDSAGEVRAVLVRGYGDRFEVRAHWQGQANSSGSLAACVRDGLDALATSDSALVVAGAADAACGMAEVEIPALKTTELRGALGFELARSCPLPPDRVAWGYRELAGGSDGRLAMRLFYMRQTSWERWLEAVGGIRLDALLPPQVALDPILDDRDVVLPVAGGGRFLLRPNGTGGRTGVPVTTVPDGAFGAGETPLAWDRLGLGPLAALSADEQAQYAPTLLLAAYGLSPEMGKSPEGALPIPYNQRPRRNQMNQFLAVALVLLTVTLGALAVWREYAARATCLAELRAERDRIDQQIAQMSATVTPIAGAEAEEDPLTVLERELRTARAEMDRPSLPMLLVELTQTVGRDAWCKSFKWDDGRVVVELDESEQDSELVRNLEASPVIGDVLVQSGRPLAGRYQETIKMNARWDTGGEEDLAVPVVPPVPGSPDGSQPPGSDEQDPTAVVPRKAPPGVPPNLLKPRKER